MTTSRPVLYTFLRCPYAIRARMTLAYATVDYETREVSLRDKPRDLLALSPKGTVPVMRLIDGTVLEQSLDIMMWTLAQHDPQQWLAPGHSHALPDVCDADFKPRLDRYKYANRHPEQSLEQHRADAAQFVTHLEEILGSQSHLCGAQHSWVDTAVFPFVRQFARCEPSWFATAPYPRVKHWLASIAASDFFLRAMAKPP